MMGLLCFRVEAHQAICVEKLKPGIFRENVKAFLPRVGFTHRSTVPTAVDSPHALEALLALGSCEYGEGAVGAQLPDVQPARQHLSERKGRSSKRCFEGLPFETFAGPMRQTDVRPDLIITCRGQNEPDQPSDLRLIDSLASRWVERCGAQTRRRSTLVVRRRAGDGYQSVLVHVSTPDRG